MKYLKLNENFDREKLDPFGEDEWDEDIDIEWCRKMDGKFVIVMTWDKGDILVDALFSNIYFDEENMSFTNSYDDERITYTQLKSKENEDVDMKSKLYYTNIENDNEVEEYGLFVKDLLTQIHINYHTLNKMIEEKPHVRRLLNNENEYLSVIYNFYKKMVESDEETVEMYVKKIIDLLHNKNVFLTKIIKYLD